MNFTPPNLGNTPPLNLGGSSKLALGSNFNQDAFLNNFGDALSSYLKQPFGLGNAPFGANPPGLSNLLGNR